MLSALEILKKYWGYDAFRLAQIPIIESVTSGQDTLGLLTTGGGKSICFQVPAMMSEGTCIVISPLIALMKDQVNQLNRRKIPAAAYYSAQSKESQTKILDYLLEGKLKFLYISPERLNTKDFQTRLRQIKVNLIVIDEAHCISQWGYDFRPTYLRIPNVYEIFPNIPKLALTATAAPRVIVDIQEKLEMKDPKVFVSSYFKSNLSYQIKSSERKVEDLVSWINRLSGSGLVYVNRRNAAEELAKQLATQFNIQAEYYHAGLSAEVRNEKQEKWLNNPLSVMITTNAFGMGIDNPHVNYVIHYHFPASLEAYFQECGRAGRTGQKSYAIALVSDADKIEKDEIIRDYPSIQEVQNLALLLFNHFDIPYETGLGRRFDWIVEDFNTQYKLNYWHTAKCLQILVDNELIFIQDAFYKPDEIQLLADERTISDLAEQFPEYGQLLTHLIRAYEGLHFKKRVNLYKLAKTYHYNLTELKISLQKLAQKGIINYEPSTNKPTIEFLTNKTAANDVPIDQTQYRVRKQILLDQTKACLDFIKNTKECRSRQLLNYLGESHSEKCGICDVCLVEKNSITKEDYLKIRDVILANLEPNIYTAIDKLIKLLKNYPELAIRKVLDRLLELNQVEKGVGEVFRKLK
ncbi:MAG: ATP-dependent DNA helicase RecQ [Chitinophagales bacterium]|jgi:ATP-dependent DNA helicase RecQ|nr:RecQ family ATP-dependent DNA helicase [Sphingobacteriales bacterium]